MPRTRTLILQDCEPDDYLAMMVIYSMVSKIDPTLVITVSPKAKEHTQITKDLFKELCTRVQVDPLYLAHVPIYEGATYKRDEVTGETIFIEPEDQSYIDAMVKFFDEAPEESVDVYLMTTCYALMGHWKDEWTSKIRCVYHMGGVGVDEKGYGFNWRVGFKWVEPMLQKIPYGRLILLETRFYNPFFKKNFDGIVSICPRTFPKFTNLISELLEKGDTLIHDLVTHNYNWISRMLEDWPDGRQFYPDKGKEHLYFGPSDVCLALFFTTFCKDLSGIKIIPNCEDRTIVLNQKKYSYYSVRDMDLKAMESKLVDVIEYYTRCHNVD